MMVYQLSMDKSLSIKALRECGMSERAISESLGISRNAVRRQLAGDYPNGTKAPTGSVEVRDAAAPSVSRSRCERFREVILSKLEQGLDSQRIYQDLVEEHGFDE